MARLARPPVAQRPLLSTLEFLAPTAYVIRVTCASPADGVVNLTVKQGTYTDKALNSNTQVDQPAPTKITYGACACLIALSFVLYTISHSSCVSVLCRCHSSKRLVNIDREFESNQQR